jgi:acetyltransferase-like isoleucine patch superfamily enzyme
MYSVLKGIYTTYNNIILWFYKVYLRFVGVSVGDGLEIRGIPQVYSSSKGKISIGIKCKLYSSPASNPVGINHKCIVRTLLPDAIISIGDRVGMSGTTILARKSIIIGNNVLFGGNCMVTDSDHHPVDPELRKRNSSKGIASIDVVINDNVWLGMNVLVMKGVTIGKNTIVGAGSVVIKDLPANVIAGGNPAVVIKTLDQSEL